MVDDQRLERMSDGFVLVSVPCLLTLHHLMMRMSDGSERFANANAMTIRHSEGDHERDVLRVTMTTLRQFLSAEGQRLCKFEMLHVELTILDYAVVVVWC